MPRKIGTPYPKQNDLAGRLYVMALSDGRSKIGYSNNPESRRRSIENEPRHKNEGVRLELVWQSDIIEGVRRFEARAKLSLGVLPWGGTQSGETFDLPPAALISAAQNAILAGPLVKEPKRRKSKERLRPENWQRKIAC